MPDRQCGVTDVKPRQGLVAVACDSRQSPEESPDDSDEELRRELVRDACAL